MNHTEDESLCRVARTILDTPGFALLLFIEIVTGLVATVLNCLLLRVLWRVSVFHRNLRLLLLHFRFSLAWYSFGYVVKAGLLLPATISSSLADACSMRTRNFDCRLREIPYSIPVQTAVFNELAISLERLWSTVRYRQYSEESVPWIAVLLVPLCYVVPVFNIVNSLAKISPGQMVAVCENLLSMTPSGATTSLANNLVALLISVIVVGVVWYWNGYKLRAMMTNKARHTLTSRFEIDQNIQINKIIVPDCAMQLFFYIPNYVFMFLVVLDLPLNYETRTILIHVNYLWKIAYALAHPVLVLMRNAHVRRRVKELIPPTVMRAMHLREETSPTVAIINKEKRCVTRTHFQILEDAWNSRPNG